MRVPFEAYSLLFLSRNPTRQESPNMRGSMSPDRRAGQLLALAQRLGSGLLREHGTRLRLLTNDPGRIEGLVSGRRRAAPGFEPAFDVVRVEVEDLVPSSAPFHAATHKIFAFRHFAGSGPGCKVLLDLDVLCAGGLAPHVVDRMVAGVPMVYDLTDHAVTAVGYPRMARDMARLCGSTHDFRWFGGEFIAGDAPFFGELFARVSGMLGAYRECHGELCHQGDEILVSAALSAWHERRAGLFDAGAHGVVQRQWLIQDERDVRRLRAALPAFLHLPGMKSVLDSPWGDGTVAGFARWLDRRSGSVARKSIRLAAALAGRGGRGWG